MKTVVVTGATGYLGSEIVKALVHNNFEVIVLKRKSSDLSRLSLVIDKIKDCFDIEQGLDSLFVKHKIHGIIHCATDYGRGGHTAAQIVDVNVLFPLTLLTCGVRHGMEFFINTGTLLEKNTNDYALSKHQFQEWLQKYSTQTVCVNLSLEHFYGHDNDSSKFITWLIRQTLAGQSIPLTKGEQKRDFLYISDVVDAYLTILRNIFSFDKSYHQFEVGSGQAILIKDLVLQISKICAPHMAVYKFGEIPYRPNERMDSKVDITPLSRLGWAPKVPLAEGLKRTVDSIKQK